MFDRNKMQTTARLRILLATAATACAFAARIAAQEETGFTPLFNGVNLDGWTLVGKHGPGYVVRDGVLVCPADGGGNLFTVKEYSDFVLRFEFKLAPGGNNGVGIRAPLTGDAAYMGMEIQVLDDDAAQYATLQPWQYHGSVYGIVPAKRGALKKAGEWNEEEIVVAGRRIRVTVNSQVTVNANLNDVTESKVLQSHPGMLRDRGHIGLLGHSSHVEFRNLRIKELPVLLQDNSPPEGFAGLFNGKDLSGWKGLVADPPKRAKMAADALAAAQAKADQRMRDHWQVADGVLVFDGKGDSLCTVKDYADFELHVDWKIKEKGDSGIYIRGSPQVQIWDNPIGSGGLYNNKNNPSNPIKVADRPVGEWNRFCILMTGEKVTVYLNNELVAHNVTMENYWERDKPIYPTGQIELQSHGNTLYFKNIYLREITR
jgi:hypothetical protein